MIGRVEFQTDVTSASLAASSAIHSVMSLVRADGDVDVVHGSTVSDDFKRLRLQPSHRRALVSLYLEIHGLAPGVLRPLPGAGDNCSAAVSRYDQHPTIVARNMSHRGAKRTGQAFGGGCLCGRKAKQHDEKRRRQRAEDAGSRRTPFLRNDRSMGCRCDIPLIRYPPEWADEISP